MAENIYYVYQYVDDKNIPYYIGKGSGSRIHAYHGGRITVPYDHAQRQILKDKLSETAAYDLETKLIRKFKRKIDGGLLDNIRIDNRWTRPPGWKQTAKAKQKISNGNKGKVRTEAQKKNYSKPKSTEHANNIRLANIGRKPDGRQIKGAIKMREYKWFNNGLIAKMFKPGTEPVGFELGRKTVKWGI